MQTKPPEDSTRRRGRSRNPYRLLGDALLLAGAVLLVIAAAAYVTESGAGGQSLPQPVALAGVAETVPAEPASEVATPQPTSEPMPTAASTPAPIATEPPKATPTPAPTPVSAIPGVPVRMVIPRIELDSEVREIGAAWVNGQLIWETIPFLVGHYKTTAKAGEKGNAVFSGHVTSRNAGNVFRDLYKLKLGDEIRVYSDQSLFTYVVSSIRLVAPTEISVMNPTPDATVTLITCAGEWIPDKRDYTQRLIVAARLVSARPVGEPPPMSE